MEQQFFMAIVESRNDPLKLGRVQIRIFGVHSEILEDVPTESLPWAIPLMPATSASLSGIGHSGTQYIEGTMVIVFFMDGASRQQPMIMGSMHGIPINKDPLSSVVDTNAAEIINNLNSSSTQTSSVQPTTSNTLIDSSGTPVTDSSGAPVVSNPIDTTSPPLDISDMVAKFGSNVTLVYNTLKDFGITEPNALIAILSNVAKECKFIPVRESLSYTSVSRLRAIFPSTFSSISDADAEVYLNNEKALANLVYANRYGNGNAATGDGYVYRGGGFIQLAFKSNYYNVGSKIGVDLIKSPDSITTASVGAKAAAQFFVNSYGGANRISFSSLDEALKAITRKVNFGGFANDYPKVVAYSKLCKIVTDTTAEQVISKELEQPNSPENDVTSTATTQQINSGTASKNTVSSASGFKDPSGRYPLSSLLNEQDTSRLSRRNTKDTLIDKRAKNKRTGIKTVGGTFSEPASAYNAQYPFNHVYTTESGHALEFDDTPGNERINLYHKSGTFTEIDKYGNQVNKIVGDTFSITERNGYIYIDGTARISIGSDVKLSVGGNLDIEVEGNINYNVGGSVNWKIGGDSITGIGGVNSVRSGGSMDADAASINLNSGSSVAVATSARSGNTNDYPLQIPENFSGSESILFDDADAEDVDVHRAQEIKKGNITQKQLDDGNDAAAVPIAEDTTVPKTSPVALPESCAAFADKTSISDTTQLSKYFSLGMLSSNAVVSHYKVTAQRKLTIPEIVCNLKNLAENSLDAIKAKYPNMKVTSAFRTGSGTSQHELGMAADMQFDGASKSDYYDIALWIKDNVLYDQLLLEYKTFGTGLPWIHISYSSGGNRKQILTFMNNKKVNNGLAKLQG
jgi:predicted chitinase